jgi:hypothetical protein
MTGSIISSAFRAQFFFEEDQLQIPRCVAPADFRS